MQIVWLFCMTGPHSLLYVISVHQLYSIYFTDIIYYKTIKKSKFVFELYAAFAHKLVEYVKM